jgi:hypothetical protein
MREDVGDSIPAFPRCVRRKEIEQAYGLKPAVFSRLVAKGIMPLRVPGTRMWDRRAIDHALDKISGLGDASNDNATEADRWFRENGDESRT